MCILRVWKDKDCVLVNDVLSALAWAEKRFSEEGIKSGDDFLNLKKEYQDIYISLEQAREVLREAFGGIKK